MDTKPYSDSINRYWRFRKIGYGQDLMTWKKIVSALKLIGYDYVLSIEHEDDLMSVDEGLQKGFSF